MAEQTRTESEKLAGIAIQALEDHKAVDVRAIDISKVSVIADYFIIANGTSQHQNQALCDAVEGAMGRAGHPAKQIEGYGTAKWILLDFGEIIVHVFDAEDRMLYDLEKIWRDGKSVDPETLRG